MGAPLTATTGDDEDGDAPVAASSIDVFVSHWSGDDDAVRPLVDALQRQGLTVWVDWHDIKSHASISESVRQALAGAKMLLAYYSLEYPTRPACQWELTAAFTAAQAHGHDPLARVLAINPCVDERGGMSTDHVHPVQLRDALFPTVPPPDADASHWREEAERIAALARALDGPLGMADPRAVEHVGRRLIAAPGFVGRQSELWRVHSLLSASDAAAVTGEVGGDVAQVTGLGGIGKSQLAEEYAVRFGGAYPGGICWLSLSELGAGDERATAARFPVVRRVQLRALADALSLPLSSATPDEVEAGLAQELARRGRCLWVVDDVPTGLTTEQVRTLIAPHPSARTLFTTRSRRYELASALHLGPLSPEQGLQVLLAHRSPSDLAETEAAQRIVEDVGGHPLGLRLASHLLAAEQGLASIAEVRARLRDPTQDELDLAQHLSPELPNGHEVSITSTLVRTIDGLGSRGKDALGIAAHLAATPIPKRFVAEALTSVEHLDMRRAQRAARDGVAEAVAVSLAEATESFGGAFVVHPLVSRVVQYHRERHERTQALVAASAEAMARMFRDVADSSSAQHLPFVVTHARALISPVPAGVPEDVALQLMTVVARHDYLAGEYESAVALHRHVAEAFARIHGQEHWETLVIDVQLSGALRAQGRLKEAERLGRVALAGLESQLGPLERETLSARSELASTFVQLGRLKDAQRMYAEAVAGLELTLGPEDPTTLIVKDNLASVLYDRRKFEQASTLQTEVVGSLRRVLGDAHPDTLTARHHLASTMRARGALTEALTLQMELVQLHCDEFGDEHPDTLAVKNNLAHTLLDLDALDEAVATMEGIIEPATRVFGPDHPRTLVAKDNLATVLTLAGDVTRAQALRDEVVAGMTRTLGPRHPSTRRAKFNRRMTKPMGKLARKVPGQDAD